MIPLQIFWGLFLAVILGFAFRRAWKWEHGSEAHGPFVEKYGKETFVFVPPTVLFWILFAFLVIFVWNFGPGDGLTHFAAVAMEVLLLLSAYFLVLLILLPLLRQWFSARACALLWLVPAFLSWQAHVLYQILPLPLRTIYIPMNVLHIVGIVWLTGFAAVGGYYLISHLVFHSGVRKHTIKDQDEETLSILQREQNSMDYRRPVTLLRGDVSAPFSMGQTKRSRCTVLPDRSYTPEELSMIFRHELHHLQRCDVDTKVFLCLCNALCWFNPLVWIATRNAADDLERSCDEIVTENMSDTERRAYAKLLLDAAAPGRGCTTCLSAAAGTLRYRLKSIMNRRRSMPGTLLLMATLFICVMSFGLVSISDSRGSFTSLILTPEAEIQAVFDDNSGSVKWDDTALREVLNEIELEHITGLRSPVLSGDQITFTLPGGRFATLMDQVLIVRGYRRNGSTSDCYLVKTPVDWESLRACFR